MKIALVIIDPSKPKSPPLKKNGFSGTYPKMLITLIPLTLLPNKHPMEKFQNACMKLVNRIELLFK
ncbi:hypothetical protein CLU81_1216 [Flavobacterium sp. 9]|uniref:hypothetical protein n=1 Tax=Flavobacterium sp. 9 TaxID=2035198 RepID=UPI000C18A24E|nr:hypothetical protein [Flavobacterium sp. 9]PIF30767.1 hypothetical protein CLU81_1216 [Flavobacterium sp. 9]